jgi:hypothetical protein
MKLLTLLVSSALVGGVALAQPAPQPPPSGNKVDAKALMQSGIKLFEAKDYLGALVVFRDAYTRFPSSRILINIGTTLKVLGRDAEAANAYQAYLDSPDAEAAKKPQLETIVAEIDKSVGKLEISVTPADAEVQVNSDDWTTAANAKRYRVAPGSFTVNARKDKFQSEAKQAQITGGEIRAISLTLAALPQETRVVEVPVVRSNGVDSGVRAESDTRSRIGVLAIAHLDVPLDDRPRGGAILVGATGDLTEQLRAQAALIIGPTADSDVTISGAFAGASFAFLSGDIRPLVSAGMPVFFSNGARWAVRGAGGVEWQINKHISFIAELGLEYVFNPEPMYKTNVFVPAIGASGRL